MRHNLHATVVTLIYLALFGLCIGLPLTEAAAAPLSPGVYHTPFSAAASNVPNDLDDIAYSSTAALGAANSGCSLTSTYNAGYRPRSMAVGDIDRDGKLDLVVANWYGYAVGVLRGDGNGGFYRPYSTVRYDCDDGQLHWAGWPYIELSGAGA